MRRCVLGLVFLSLLILPTSAAFAQTGGGQGSQDPVEVVTGFLNAGKSKNYDLAMTYFADNATITNKVGQVFGGGTETYTTGDQIRKQFIETAPSDLQVVSIQGSGNTVTAVARSIEQAHQGPQLSGLDYFDFVFVATVVNGKIQSGTLDLTAETKAAIQAAIAGSGAPAGMPRTGNAASNLLPLGLALLGLALAGGGTLLVRTRP